MCKFFKDYDKAKEYADLLGGWVLMDDGFIVCDDPGIVKDLRGQEWMDECERQQCWDETLLKEAAYGTLRVTSVHYDCVKAFTEAMGQPVGKHIEDIDNAELLEMRVNLINEEVKEVLQELPMDYRPGGARMDKAALTKELADLLYVTYGMAVTFGLPIDEVFERVHRSNMSKLGVDGRPIYREDGKVLKGPNYEKPNLEDLF